MDKTFLKSMDGKKKERLNWRKTCRIQKERSHVNKKK